MSYRVRTDLTVRPELVDPTTFGHFRSYVTEGGTRLWFFDEEEGAKLFTTYANRGEFRLKGN